MDYRTKDCFAHYFHDSIDAWNSENVESDMDKKYTKSILDESITTEKKNKRVYFQAVGKNYVKHENQTHISIHLQIKARKDREGNKQP